MESALSSEGRGFLAFAFGISWGCGRLGGWRSGRLCATRGQADMRGFGDAAGPWFVVGSRCLASGVASPSRGGLLIAPSRVPRALPGRHRPSRRDSDCRREWSLDLADRPGKPGEFAGCGNRDDRAALGALFRAWPRCGGVAAELTRRRRWLRRAGRSGGRSAPCRSGARAVVPGGLDEQPAGVPGPGLGDRPEPALLPGR